MTNEEKAKEISEIYGRGYTFYHSGGEYYVGDSIEECCESALQMAQWKDELFSNYIKERIKKYAGSSAAQNSTLFCELNEIHQELFGEPAHNTIPNYGLQ